MSLARERKLSLVRRSSVEVIVAVVVVQGVVVALVMVRRVG